MTIEELLGPPPATTDWVPIWNLGAVPSGPISTRITRSTAFSCPQTAWTVVPFDTARYDNGSQWVSGAPTRLTCKVAGTYLIWGMLQWSGSTNTTYRLARIMLNGTTELSDMGVSGQSGVGGGRSETSTLIQLAVGDYVELQAYQDTAGALTTIAPSPTGYASCEFAMALLGGPGPQGPAGPQGPTGSGGSAAPFVTTLPASPGDNQTAILVDSLSAPTYQWTMQYSVAAGGWLCTGGTGWLEGTTTVTVPRAGNYYCEIGGQGIQIGPSTNDERGLQITAGGILLQARSGQGGGQNNNDDSSMFDKGKMIGLTTSQVLTPTVSGTPPPRQYIRIQPVKMT